jgi:hypothetical protein
MQEMKKSFERPETGPFYLIPDPKTGKYTLLASFDSPGKDEVHLFLWSSVIEILRRRFKNSDVDLLADKYRSLPRGRVMAKGDHEWVVGHGRDFPLDQYKSEIISEFKLSDAESINKLEWEFSNHETMSRNEKAEMENILGIAITPQGFKNK